MALRRYPNGLGGTTDALAAASNIEIRGATTPVVYFVDSQTGNGAYTGFDRGRPLPTIASALSAIGANDDRVIVCLSGHTESMNNISVSQRVVIIGEGQASGKPTVGLTLNHTTNTMLTFASGSAGSELRNVKLLSNTGPTSHAGNLLSIAAGHCRVDGCYVGLYSSQNIAGVGLTSAAVGTIIRSTSFVIDETGGRPVEGLLIDGADYCELSDLVFDAGTGIWESVSGTEPIALRTANTPEGLKARNISFLRGGGASVAANGYLANISGTENAYVSA